MSGNPDRIESQIRRTAPKDHPAEACYLPYLGTSLPFFPFLSSPDLRGNGKCIKGTFAAAPSDRCSSSCNSVFATARAHVGSCTGVSASSMVFEACRQKGAQAHEST